MSAMTPRRVVVTRRAAPFEARGVPATRTHDAGVVGAHRLSASAAWGSLRTEAAGSRASPKRAGRRRVLDERQRLDASASGTRERNERARFCGTAAATPRMPRRHNRPAAP